MAQWINVLWNSSFVSPMRLHLLCEKTGTLGSHIGTGSYGRPLGIQKCCKIRTLNSVYLTFKYTLGILNRFLKLDW